MPSHTSQRYGKVAAFNPPGFERQRPRIQGRTHSDVEFCDRYSCAEHQIVYYTPKGGPHTCPLCEVEDRLDQIQGSFVATRNELELLRRDNHNLKIQVDLVEAMREALGIISPEDLTFLKTVCYRWRSDRAINLKVTHGKPAKKRDDPPCNGFLAQPRGGEPEAHRCDSAGGVALATYYEEAQQTVGGSQAMTLLIRALSSKSSAELP